jgi:hypothetical protein
MNGLPARERSQRRAQALAAAVYYPGARCYNAVWLAKPVDDVVT